MYTTTQNKLKPILFSKRGKELWLLRHNELFVLERLRMDEKWIGIEMMIDLLLQKRCRLLFSFRLTQHTHLQEL